MINYSSGDRRPLASRARTFAVGVAATLGLIIGSAVMAQPANAFVTFGTEGESSFGGYADPLNIDVCWKSSLSPIWVEATRRATAAWNAATPSVHFRSLRAVSARVQNCDLYVYDTLDFDTSHDGVISRAEGNVRAEGGRRASTARIGAKTVWNTHDGFVKINTRSPFMQKKGIDDLNSFQSTMVHELGHVLGLKHTQPANYSRSMMSPSTSPFIVPQPDDIAGIKFIYGKVAVVPAVKSNLVSSEPLTSMTRAYWLPAGSSQPNTPSPADEPTAIDTDMPATDAGNKASSPDAAVPAAPVPPAVPVSPAKPVTPATPTKPATPVSPAVPVNPPTVVPVLSTPVPPASPEPKAGKAPKPDSSSGSATPESRANGAKTERSNALPIVPTILLVVLSLLLAVGVIIIVRWRRISERAITRSGNHRD